MIKPRYSISIPFIFFIMTCLKYLSLTVFLFLCLPAYALTLGDVNVNSYINHNLDAKIEVLSSGKINPDKIKAFLASKEVFKKYDLLRDSFLDNIHFSITQENNGKTHIHLTSKHKVREPLVSLIVTLRSLEGNITREYNLFLNPSPNTRVKKIQIPDVGLVNDPNENFQQKKNINAVKSINKVAAAKTIEKKLQKKNAYDPLSYRPDLNFLIDRYPVVTTYGPVIRGTVISMVAQKIRPNNTYSVQKISKFLFQFNPQAFINNDINKLILGSTLNVPDLNRPEFRKESFAYLDQEEMQYQQSPVKQEIAKEEIKDKSPVTEDTSTVIEHSEGELKLISDDQDFIDEEISADRQGDTKEVEEAQKLLQISIGEIKLLKDENQLIREQFDLLMGRMEEVINKNKLLDEELKALKELKVESTFTEQNNIEPDKTETSSQATALDSKIAEDESQQNAVLAMADDMLNQVKKADINWSYWIIIILAVVLFILISVVVIRKWKNRRETIDEEFSLDHVLDDVESKNLNDDPIFGNTDSADSANDLQEKTHKNKEQSKFTPTVKETADSLLETGLPDIDFSAPQEPKPKIESARSFGLQLDEASLPDSDKQDKREFGLKIDESDLSDEQDLEGNEFELDLDELTIPSDTTTEAPQDNNQVMSEISVDENHDKDLPSTDLAEELYQQKSKTDNSIPNINFNEVLGPSKSPENIDLLSQSSVYFAYGKFDLAEQLLIDGIEESPENTQLKLKLFECYAKMDNEIKFMSYLEQESKLCSQDNEFNEKIKKMYLNTWGKELF